jgi:hypothetical protein
MRAPQTPQSVRHKDYYYSICLLLLVRQAGYIVNLSDFYSYRLIRKLTDFFPTSRVQSAQSTSVQFHFRRTAFSSGFNGKVDLALAKTVPFDINLNLDVSPIASKSHTHPSHSQTSRLPRLTSSLSLGIPVPRPTQCV